MKSVEEEFWDKQRNVGVGTYTKVSDLGWGFVIKNSQDNIGVVFNDEKVENYDSNVLEHSYYIPEKLIGNKKAWEDSEFIRKLLIRYKDLFYQYKFKFMEPLPLSQK